ncbi:EPS-associated MarR family transcriptional regulator [Halospina denitrificans]|uniref:EPS-associated MarR family transcriptional regulator n=1 Tax=Halospina denitrificans TaxID=332522 RepID=A0A4V3EQU9_9GAMM|nr:MarR family EPS-associated transcriptional regulator [Halospina denitrificans]TDT43458.1 EPS-associated MarR family transcriptional regulator [Halospina denitrificans]
MFTDNERYQLLRALEQNPNLSQRQLAIELGYSLGKLNYCLRAFKEKGWVKAENFRNSQNKSAYFYQLTPAGVTEKARVTRRFLQRKLEEYEQIEQEIEALKQEVAQQQL